MDIKRLSGADLGRCFEVDRSTIMRWRRAGMPVEKGLFSLPACIRWRLDREIEAMAPKEASPEGEKWLTAYRRERARMARLQRLKMQGDLIDADSVLKAQALVCGAFKNAVRSWKSRLPPMLAGKDQDSMLPIIQTEVDTALRSLSVDLVKAPAEEPDAEPIEKKTTKGKKP